MGILLELIPGPAFTILRSRVLKLHFFSRDAACVSCIDLEPLADDSGNLLTSLRG
jgi:hypothetical protein